MTFFKNFKVLSQQAVISHCFLPFTFLAAGPLLKCCPTRNLSTELFPLEEEHHLTPACKVTGLMGWALPCKAKDYPFDSQSGNRPGLQVGVPGQGACERQPINISLSHRLFLSLSFPSLRMSLKI